MSDKRPHDDTPVTSPLSVDQTGQPVNVVERDLADKSGHSRGVDESITPTSVRTREQEVEELNKKTAAIERKVADGN